MVYDAKNNDKFIVYNPTDQSLFEKIYNSIPCFVLAVVNGWEFRINDTEGIKLVKYLTSQYPWWRNDWVEKQERGRLNIKNITKDDIMFLSENKLEDLYPKTKVLYVSNDSNIIPYLLDNNDNKDVIENLVGEKTNLFKHMFHYLYQLESEYFYNFQYIFNKVMNSPHVGFYINGLNHEQIIPEIENELEKGNKIFFSGDYDLIQTFINKINRRDFKSISKKNINHNDMDEESILTLLYELFIFMYLGTKIIHTDSVIKELLIDTHNKVDERIIGEDIKLIEIY